ncbi:hypothetical protein H9P43_009982 [Blastocladiella emersonii ATCC 22665]|nr:hypothetical protein H9P43_009982 [Blastocladiella emersonii ATCC 22665]
MTTTASSSPRHRLRSAALLVLVAAVVALLAVGLGPAPASASPAPAPQFTIPPINIPGLPGATPTPSASATSASATSASASSGRPASSTSQQSSSAAPTATLDPCADGRCVPEGKNRECLLLEKVWMYKEFKGLYLPLDLSAYFADRFADKYTKVEKQFPKDLVNASYFLDFFGGKPYSLLGDEFKYFNLRQAGCQLPTHRWYLYWLAVDMYDFYQARQDPCSSGGTLRLCGATLDERANQVAADFANTTYCNGPAEYKAKGEEYIKQLKSHRFRAASEPCVSGDMVEADQKHCGYYSEFGACVNADKCPDLDPDLKKRCPDVIKNFNSQFNAAATADGVTKTDEKTFPWVPVIIGGGAFLIVAGGLVSLRMTRRKSGAGLVATLGRTFGRTTARPGTGTAGGSAPAAPPVNFANSAPTGPGGAGGAATTAAATAAVVAGGAAAASSVAPPAPAAVTDTQPLLAPSVAAYSQVGAASNATMAGSVVGTTADTRASMYSYQVDPASGAVIAASSPAMAATAVQYVDQYGNPVAVDPATGYMVAASTGGSAEQHQYVLNADGSVTTTTLAQQQQQQQYDQQQQHMTTTTTTTTEQMVYYVDQNGNPVDAQGNPVAMPQPMMMAPPALGTPVQQPLAMPQPGAAPRQ